MWKCVKLKSFICLLSFCNAPSSQDLHMFIILNAFYEILMSTSEMRNDEAVLFIIIKKKISQKWVLFPPDFGSLLCTTPGLRPREWLTAVEHSWKCRKWGKKKGYFRYRISFSERVTLFNMVQIINKLSHILYLFLSTKANQTLLVVLCFFFFF